VVVLERRWQGKHCKREVTYELKLQSRVGILRVLVRMLQQRKLAKLRLNLDCCHCSSESKNIVEVDIDTLRHSGRSSVGSQVKTGNGEDGRN
jgi:hypothetical protein